MVVLHFASLGVGGVDAQAITIHSADYDWPLWPMSDSATPFCYDHAHAIALGDLVDSYCSDPTVIPFQDGLSVDAPVLDDFNGYFIDRTTGLVWAAPTNASSLSESDALTYCASLTNGGFTWRLPTRIEMVSLMDLGKYPAVQSGGTNAYITASGVAGGGNFWRIGLDGAVDGAPNGIVQCVAGAATDLGAPVQPLTQAPPDQYAGDALTVTDVRTGLQWERHHSSCPPPCTWEKALALCDALVLVDKGDWRVPTLKELLTLIDDRTQNPAIDQSQFTDVTYSSPLGDGNEDFWTSSPIKQTSASPQVWTVRFYDGITLTEPYNAAVQVRCVRGGR